MKCSELKSLLNKITTVEDFKNLIKLEVDQLRALASTKGSSLPILFVEDDSLEIAPKDLLYLLSLFTERKLDAIELSYIVDAILLSDKVSLEDENLLELIEELTDFEVNGILTGERANEIINNLKS